MDLDVIGILYSGGTYDDHGGVIVPPVAVAGWHVNTSAPVPAFAGREVSPTHPRRVFFGGETFCYVFASQADFEAAARDAGLIDGAA